MTLRELLRMRRAEPVDPPEPWEREVSPQEGPYVGRGGLAGHPYRPLRWQDVPAPAADALARSCGARELDQLFVIPESARRTGRRGHWVAAETQVLGISNDAVGLWVAGDEPSVRTRIGTAELVAIQDIHFLLYGRLSFLGDGRRLTVRYNAVARHELQPGLLALRRTLAGPSRPLPVADVPPALPFKWQAIAAWPTVRLHRDDPAVLLFGRSMVRRRPPWPVLLALTGYELIAARSPGDDKVAAAFGVETLHPPRRRLDRVGISAQGLQVQIEGAELDVPLDPELVTRAQETLGALLPGPCGCGADTPAVGS
jgi:hypothetical protein